MSKPKRLMDILESLELFQVVQCQMHHEKIAVDLDAKPLYAIQDDEVVFERVNLCEIKVRNRRLGCAHSKVNIDFEKVLDDLYIILPEFKNEISIFKIKFRAIMADIYDLDHKVGNLERDISISELYGGNEKDSLLKVLKLYKETHTSLINRLFQIKSDIKQFLLKHIHS